MTSTLNTSPGSDIITVPFVIKGSTFLGDDADFGSFKAPALDLDQLVWQRNEPGPAFDTPIADIIDFLVEVGHALDLDKNHLWAEALENSLKFNTLERRILENTYRATPAFFDRKILEFQVASDTGRDVIDGWATRSRPDGTDVRVRAFPPRLAHITAGNTPAVAITTVLRGALSKGVHLLKVPANDLFTASAILRTMAMVDPDHPTTKSFSAVYWRGGDDSVESVIMRSQFFDKLVVWGGTSSVNSALKWAAPGFEIVSFDPKVSMSLVSKEAITTPEGQRDAAERAATDISLFNQDACAASRFLYTDGGPGDVDAFCEMLADELKVERFLSSAVSAPLNNETQDEVEALRALEPIFRVWGDYSGAGLVIRSEDPVDFYPMSKTVNVVVVENLEDALKYANVATQTVGIYPPERAADLRDELASRGVQRIARLGEVASQIEGLPHDGFYPISRVMRWVLEDV